LMCGLDLPQVERSASSLGLRCRYVGRRQL
jgi:hypothetical protein